MPTFRIALCFVTLLLAALLIGCAPSKKDVAAARFGPRPDRCERIIQQQMDTVVFIGSAGDYMFNKAPFKAAVKRNILAKNEFGWVVEFEAKGPLTFGTGGFRIYHYFFPSESEARLLNNDAIIHRIDE